MSYFYKDREGRKWQLFKLRASEIPRFIRAEREDGETVSVHCHHLQTEPENNGGPVTPVLTHEK